MIYIYTNYFILFKTSLLAFICRVVQKNKLLGELIVLKSEKMGREVMCRAC
jgi:hypothetical protein